MTFLMYFDFERLGKSYKLAESRNFCLILFIVCFDMFFFFNLGPVSFSYLISCKKSDCWIDCCLCCMCIVIGMNNERGQNSVTFHKPCLKVTSIPSIHAKKIVWFFFFITIFIMCLCETACWLPAWVLVK